MTYLYEKLKNIVKIFDSLIYDLFSDISQIFLIIFYFIEKYNSKLKSEEEGITSEKNFEKYNQFSMEQVFFFVSLLIFKIIFNYNIIIFNNKINEIGIFVTLILFLMLLERFIFKKNIYSHQIFSISMIFIIFLCYLIFNINESNYNKLSYILSILSSYSLSFCYLLIKYINTNYFINIYLLATILGISGTIQFLILKYNKIITLLYIYDGLEKNIIIILYFITVLVDNFLFFKIVSILNPFHAILIDNITTFIFEMIITKDFNHLNIILLLLSIIFSLIYLEIIILNFCDLNKNIKENIIERGKNEIVKELISDSESENNN